MKFALSKAQVGLAQAAMANRDTSVSELSGNKSPPLGERQARFSVPFQALRRLT